MLESFLVSARRDGWPARVRDVLVGFSGGADSSALLHLLRQASPRLGLRLRALHVHHGLRGTEADEDALFAEVQSARLGIPFETVRVDVPGRVRDTGESPEQAARALRLDAFRRVLARTGGDAVAVAHNLDDQAETLWMKVVQGVSPGGLAGMSVLATIEGVPLLRPLLGVRGSVLRAFLAAHRIPWREDRMNTDPSCLRVRVRRELLPLLESLNPGSALHAARLADTAALEREWTGPMVRDALNSAQGGRGLSKIRLQALPRALRLRVLSEWIQESGMSLRPGGAGLLERLDALIDSADGALDAGACRVRIESGELCVVADPAEFLHTLSIPGRLALRDGVLTFEKRTGWSPETCFSAFLSDQQLRGRELVARSWCPGDRYRPHRAPGTRKLKRLFADARIPRGVRPHLPIIECEGEVVWVPGFRVAHDWAVESTAAASIRLEWIPTVTARASILPAPVRSGRGLPACDQQGLPASIRF